jgi:hypothetical protein
MLLSIHLNLRWMRSMPDVFLGFSLFYKVFHFVSGTEPVQINLSRPVTGHGPFKQG